MPTVTLANLQTNLPIHLNVAAADIAAAQSLRVANWVKRNLQRRIDLYWCEASTTLSTTAGSRSLGGLPADYHLPRDLFIIDVNTRVQLAHADRQTEITLYPPVGNESRRRPERWFRSAKTIRVMPTPDAVYAVTLDYWAYLPELVSGTDNDDITNNHEELMLDGMAEIVAKENGWREESAQFKADRAEQERDLYFDMIEEGEGNSVIVSRGMGYRRL